MKKTLKAMQTRYMQPNCKFGTEVLKNVKRCLEIDTKNENTFWQDAIAKEMKTVEVAFEIQSEDAKKPVG